MLKCFYATCLIILLQVARASDSIPIPFVTPDRVLVNVGFSVVGEVTAFGFTGLKDIHINRSFSHFSDQFRINKISNSYGGLKNWAQVELLPVRGAGITNYFLHTLGEGMLVQELRQYYILEGYSPRTSYWLGLSTLLSAQVLNEIVESPVVPNGDAIADLFVFNPLGYWLYSSSLIQDLLKKENIRYSFWPGQAMLDIRDGAFYNNSELFVFQFPLDEDFKKKFIIAYGLPTVATGLSIEDSKKNEWTFALGFFPNPIPNWPYPTGVLVKHGANTIDTVPRIAQKGPIPWGVLLAKGKYLKPSWTLNIGIREPSLTWNLYPDTWSNSDWRFGAMLHLSPQGIAAGITCSAIAITPGIRF